MDDRCQHHRSARASRTVRQSTISDALFPFPPGSLSLLNLATRGLPANTCSPAASAPTSSGPGEWRPLARRVRPAQRTVRQDTRCQLSPSPGSAGLSTTPFSSNTHHPSACWMLFLAGSGHDDSSRTPHHGPTSAHFILSLTAQSCLLQGALQQTEQASITHTILFARISCCSKSGRMAASVGT